MNEHAVSINSLIQKIKDDVFDLGTYSGDDGSTAFTFKSYSILLNDLFTKGFRDVFEHMKYIHISPSDSGVMSIDIISK